jgi:DNA polymerase-3 subunit epsilon
VLVETGRASASARNGNAVVQQRPTPLAARLSDAEREAHAAFIATLGEKAIWLKYP